MTEQNAGPAPDATELVVVGVSRTSHSPAAVGWAAAEAGRRGAELLAVRAWRPSHPPAATGGRPAVVGRDAGAERADALAQLQADVTATLGEAAQAGGRPVRCEVREGSALAVLQAISREAGLLVLDAPRRTDLKTSPMLAHRLVYQAACPVVIMPPGLDRDTR